MKIDKPIIDVTGDSTGDILFRSDSGELERLSIGDAYGILSINGLATSPKWTTSGNLTEWTSDVLIISGGTRSVVGLGTSIQVKKASASQDGYLGKDDFITFSSGGHNPVTLNQSAITGGLSLNNQEISFRAANTTYDGYLKSSDWDIFNSKEPSVTKGNLTETSSGILIFGGTTTNNVIGSGTTIQVKKASALQDGYLGKDDFAIFAAGGGGGDGYWSRDLLNGYLRPITTTDTIMVGDGDSTHPAVEFGNTSSGLYYDNGNKKIIVGVDSVVKAYFDEDGLNFPGSESVSGCASASNSDVDIGTEVVDNFIPTADGACVWHYFVGNGANIRGGTIICAWDLSEEDVTYSEQSTSSLGDTSNLTFFVDISGGYLNLNATATSNNWSVKVFRLRIQ